MHDYFIYPANRVSFDLPWSDSASRVYFIKSFIKSGQILRDVSVHDEVICDDRRYYILKLTICIIKHIKSSPLKKFLTGLSPSCLQLVPLFFEPLQGNKPVLRSVLLISKDQTCYWVQCLHKSCDVSGVKREIHPKIKLWILIFAPICFL